MSGVFIGTGGWEYFHVPGTDFLAAYARAFDFLFTRVIVASYVFSGIFFVPSSGLQPPDRILPSSPNVPVYFDPVVQCVTTLP